MATTIWERFPEWAKRLTAVIGAITALVALLTTIFPWDPIRLTVALVIGGVAILAFGHMCDKVTARVDAKLDGIEERMVKRDREQELAICRLELMELMHNAPENKLEIEKTAYRYFHTLQGDTYMTTLYSKGAKKYGWETTFIVKD